MQIFEVLVNWIYVNWVTLIVIFHISLSLVTSVHVLLYKENERTSLAWIGLVILSPVIGSLFYWLFGINRIQRSAKKNHPKKLNYDIEQLALNKQVLCKQEQKDKQANFDNTLVNCPIPPNWHSAIIAGHKIHPVNYLAGNTVEPLINGDAAYPAMIQSIDDAKHSIVLSSYIFDYDSLGRQFINALAQAQKRGVAVNVLLDRIGIGYSWHKSNRALKKMGVKTASFLPAISLSSIRFINLRNHRKILCVDGEVAYVGGMNISEDNLVESSASPIDDIQFKITGPVIDQISQIFIKDWYFTTNELIEFPSYKEQTALNKQLEATEQTVFARVIEDGPDENHNKIRWTLINALVCAQKTVKIMTPYFIPDQTLMNSLHSAAMRGVSVQIIVPEHSDIPFVDWVMEANFSRIMAHGIQIYKNNRPFDHSKIVIIDDVWSFIGSTNWDARSMEFNFEINLECFDKKLNSQLTDFFTKKKLNSSLVVQSQMNKLSIYKKIRNNLFRLFSPYM
ncbi:cardiolipin synthase [Psychrosphaera saromensis]|uniref:Cardiolipin synthase n=1 Tax=Psychrosphaera saromensis TaxID=716813 RepID=A0A2S7UX02_9GAMM|nr:cardiolipin synthase [Psychrosphaera saromensis]PQJ54299.1 cardiolipin synthase [Psychrosphaera saromensis]GHB74455.1 cardiolipin synthase [Psychrosphaera saromensis]GLQ12598.1 cardiolipin synthase [Psychrosphaera saromensis]